MNLSYNIITGQPAAVALSIARSVALFRRRYRHVKVGITADPARRSYEHAADRWQRMVVKYKTSSVRNANSVEKALIARRRDLTNEWPGFSNLPQPGPYYVYILMK